ncbi:MAG: protein-export chaperone SecB, partial [Alphaproteobacteria bacterium]|nr:protein-export chaperone SecB [Alphaproteobacteria bacterium]
RGQSGGSQLFIVELAYGGLFRTAGEVPQEHLQALLMIEGPRMLFPFARNVVATVTRDGGLPPLMISPIDFVQLFRNRIARAKEESAAQGDGDGAPA